MVLVEGALFPLHVRIARPRLGNEHGHHVRKAASGLKQQLHRIIKIGGIAAVGRNDGMQLLNVLAKQR